MYWESVKVTNGINIDRIYSFFEAKYDKSYNFKGESHNFWECVYIAQGGACVSADEKVYNISKGEIIIHKPLEFHKFYISSEDDATLIIFSFSLEGELADDLRNKILILTEKEKQLLNMLLDYVKPYKKPFNKKENNFLDLSDTPSNYLQIVTSYLHLLLLSFLNNDTASTPLTDFDSVIYEKAVRFLTENIEKNLSVHEISSHCNVGETFLKLTFKKYSGESVHKFFLSLKMRYATEMLKNGHSVTEVSMHLGFCSQPYFSSAFKREFGISPTDLQRKRS